MGLESNSAVADMMGSDLIISGKVWTLQELLDKVDAVSADDVLQVANQYLKPADLHMAAIGPLSESTIKNVESLLRT